MTGDCHVRFCGSAGGSSLARPDNPYITRYYSDVKPHLYNDKLNKKSV